MGWEDALEQGTVTHSSVLAWMIPRTEEPGRLQSTELQKGVGFLILKYTFFHDVDRFSH